MLGCPESRERQLSGGNEQILAIVGKVGVFELTQGVVSVNWHLPRVLVSIYWMRIWFELCLSYCLRTLLEALSFGGLFWVSHRLERWLRG